jgi:hypothetical protein
MIELIQSWGELTLVIVGVIAVIIAGFKRIYKTAKWVEEINSTMKSVEREFRPNGGSSMRDQLNRLEAGLADNTRRTAALEAWVIKQENHAAQASAA